MTTKMPVPIVESAEKRRNTIRSFKAKANDKRTTSDKIADLLTESFGTVAFLVINAFFFGGWILWNTGNIPGLTPIDPFPFGLLTMVVSLEAIFLAIIVLISQNREARIAELREEVELYINTYAENEITKAIYLMTLILKKDGIDISKDEDLKEMLENIDSEVIEQELEKQLAQF
ncbi:MAG: DUF1003 domain-containing protein [Patescibacteria group bacterium]